MYDTADQGSGALRDRSCGHFVGAAIEVPVAPLLRLQGYRDPERIRPQVRDIATTTAQLAGGLMAPQTYFKRIQIRARSDDGLTLETDTVFRSKELAKILKPCSEVIVFVLTLGPKLDAETERRTAKDEIVEALFLETAGWIAVEKATKELAQHLTDLLRAEGLGLTRRLGPGYVDWPLEEQAALFGLLSDAPLPVRLLDSCAMMPKKSRSGLYGLRPVE